MKKEQLLDVVKITESNIRNTDNLLLRLKPVLEIHQEQMEGRKLRLFNECFPEKVRSIMFKVLDYTHNWKATDKIAIRFFDECLYVYFDDFDGELILSANANERYDEPQEWWFDQNHFEEYALPQFRTIKKENKMCDILEHHLEEIYSNIADELAKRTNEISEQHTKWLSELSDILEPARVQKTKTITITLEVPI